jgi:diadenosine tetraphosphate (Ap4A) HIT family hydrolase
MNITMKRFEYPMTLIKEFKHWTVQLRPKQVTIGSLVLINKSDAEHLGELASEEWVEFAEVSEFAENLLGGSFPVEKFNYLALMMKDPNVHFHLIPRYSGDVEFAGQTFTDPDWPVATQMKAVELDNKTFSELLTKLKS